MHSVNPKDSRKEKLMFLSASPTPRQWPDIRGGPASARSEGNRLSAEKWGTNKSTDPFLASAGLTAFRPSPQPSRMGVPELLQRGSACHGDAWP